jgi:phosphate transport system permease protein
VASLISSTRSRGVKNSLAKWLITLGGISVLFTLVLIFMYLLYVVKPIFEAASIEQDVQFSIDLASDEKVLGSGVDELQELAYQITNQGNIEFYHLKSSVEQAPSPFKIGDKALSMALLTDDSFTDKGVKFVVNSFSANKLIHTHSGETLLVQPNFFAKYNNDIREIIPQIDFPLGRSALTIDEQQAPLSHLAFAMEDEKIVFVGFTQDQRLIKTSFLAEDDFIS